MQAIKAAAAVTTATEGRSPAETLPTRRFGGRMYMETVRLLAVPDDSIEAGADR